MLPPERAPIFSGIKIHLNKYFCLERLITFLHYSQNHQKFVLKQRPTFFNHPSENCKQPFIECVNALASLADMSIWSSILTTDKLAAEANNISHIFPTRKLLFLYVTYLIVIINIAEKHEEYNLELRESIDILKFFINKLSDYLIMFNLGKPLSQDACKTIIIERLKEYVANPSMLSPKKIKPLIDLYIVFLYVPMHHITTGRDIEVDINNSESKSQPIILYFLEEAYRPSHNSNQGYLYRETQQLIDLLTYLHEDPILTPIKELTDNIFKIEYSTYSYEKLNIWQYMTYALAIELDIIFKKHKHENTKIATLEPIATYFINQIRSK